MLQYTIKLKKYTNRKKKHCKRSKVKTQPQYSSKMLNNTTCSSCKPRFYVYN